MTDSDSHALLEALRAHLPDDRLITDPVSMERYRSDESEWGAVGMPAAVCRPESTAEVAVVVRACLETRTPLVCRGAGTGLAGAANASDGCVVLSFERMNQVLEINRLESWARVQPGVINDELRAAVAEHGLWYPPDPASAPISTIGGNVATNAGGLCCVKYGVTRDYVIELEIVTGTGEVTRVGRRTRKGVVGYDLVGLIVGAEGTLAVVTEVVVRLRPLPPPATTVVGFFASLVDAGRAVATIAAAGVTPSMLELLDRQVLAAVDDWKRLGLSSEANAILLARTDAPGAWGEAEASAIQRCFEQAGATMAAVSENEQESEAMFAARRLAFPAMERLGRVLTEDICVPLSAMAATLAEIEAIGARHEVAIATVAHAGDGNLHPLMVIPRADEAAERRAFAAFEEIMDSAIAVSGTVTGEHGVGLLKLEGARREQPEAVVAMQRAVKAALDPHGILNPGKAIPGASLPS